MTMLARQFANTLLTGRKLADEKWYKQNPDEMWPRKSTFYYSVGQQTYGDISKGNLLSTAKGRQLIANTAQTLQEALATFDDDY